MPTAPPANDDQKELLIDLGDLSRNEAVSLSNQIKALEELIARLTNGQVLFQDRYNFWQTFITHYETERRRLDGGFVASPIITSDFTAFMAQTGRLYNAALPTPSRFAPVRISQFDGSPRSTDSLHETDALDDEETARLLLLNGFTSTFPTGYRLIEDLNPGDTQMKIDRVFGFGVPVINQYVLVTDGSSAAIVFVTDILLAAPGDIYILEVEVRTQSFATLGSFTSTLVPGLSPFNNTERTTKVASDGSLQSVLDGLIQTYETAVTYWKNQMQAQRNEIVANTTEDAPDTAYVNSQLSTLNALIAYLPGMDVSNSGLAANQALNLLRTTEVAARVSYIPTRLATGGSGAYDGRYNYGNRLYNLVDGTILTIQRTQEQKAHLLEAQAACNDRAAIYDAEIF